MVKKKNKCASKRKEQLAKHSTPVGSLLSFCSKSTFFLSLHSVLFPMPVFVPTPMLAFVPTSVPAPVLALLSHLRSPVVLLSGYVSIPAAVFYCGIPALMSPISMLSLPLPLGSLFLRTFKQFLSNVPQPCVSTSFAKHFYLFPALGALNLDNNNDLL